MRPWSVGLVSVGCLHIYSLLVIAMLHSSLSACCLLHNKGTDQSLTCLVICRVFLLASIGRLLVFSCYFCNCMLNPSRGLHDKIHTHSVKYWSPGASSSALLSSWHRLYVLRKMLVLRLGHVDTACIAPYNLSKVPGSYGFPVSPTRSRPSKRPAICFVR